MTKRREWPRNLTVEGLARAYRDGTATPEEAMGVIVSRAAEDAAMNIWIVPPSMERIAPYLERLSTLDPERAPLWGIPFAVKDNIDVAGMPTTAGCPQYAYAPERHAAVVERLVAAGAVPVGKANLDQFATGLVGTRSPYGETHNALRPELISGGSSSGSAVAVARGHAAFALGTDTAGSGRVPAALHGLVGWKPSIGAWPSMGVVPACASLDCVTVFAHSMADALRVDRIARGPHPDDPWSRAVPMGEPRLPKRVLLPETEPEFYGRYADGYRAAWQRSVGMLERMGLPVERIDAALFAEAAALLYEGPWVAERWAALGGFVDSHPGAALEVTERILRSGASGGHDAAAVFRASHRLQRLKHAARRLLDDAVLAMPTCGGTWTREEAARDPFGANSAMGRYTNHCNLLDLCAVALPSGEAEPGVPFGVTLFAPHDGEHTLAGAAALFAKTAGAGASQAAAVQGKAAQVYVGQGETGQAFAVQEKEAQFAAAPGETAPDVTPIAVCGLHMRGYPLEKQMIASGARFLRTARSAPRYRLVKLPTEPAKPGMIKLPAGGSAIEVELWEMPLASLGTFAAAIPAPLGLGKVELEDGTEVPGFICEGYAETLDGAADITFAGGWRYAAPTGATMTGE